MSLIKSIGKKLLGKGVKVPILLGFLKGSYYRLNKFTALSPMFGNWERDSQLLFTSFVKPGDIVYDLGANTGIHSMLFAKIVGNKGMVYACEPMKYNIDEINLIKQYNLIENIEIVPEAIANTIGLLEFAIGEHTKGGSLEIGLETLSKVKVPVNTIDNLIKKSFKLPDFIKIDIEGAEGAALEGMEQAVQQCHPSMYIELHTPEQDIKVGTFLAKHGYEVYRLRTESAVRINGQTKLLQKIKNLTTSYPDPSGIWGCVLALHPSKKSSWETALTKLT
jgi:FkbM family methyltransferase